MSPNHTESKAFSKVTIDLDDPEQLAAVAQYYLMDKNDYMGQSLDPVVVSLRRALEEFHAEFSSDREGSSASYVFNLAQPYDVHDRILFSLLSSLLVILVVFVTVCVFNILF